MAESSIPAPIRLRDRGATEAAIVEAGERLLLRDGMGGVNVQTLAAEARCDRKLIYRYFDSADGVVDRVAARAHAALAQALDAVPAAEPADLRAFARESLLTWLRVLRASPVSLRLMAWTVVEDSDLMRRLEADRAAILQAWMRARRPRLKTPPSGDVVAFNAVVLAAVQHLVLAGAGRGAFAGVPLDDAGWARIESALDQLTNAFPA